MGQNITLYLTEKCLVLFMVHFKLTLNNSDGKRVLFIGENRFDWSHSEIRCLLLKTSLTSLIVKQAFQHKYSPVIISWYLRWNVYLMKAKEA